MKTARNIRPLRTRMIHASAYTAAAIVAITLTAWSAIVVKQAAVNMPLASTRPLTTPDHHAPRPGAQSRGHHAAPATAPRPLDPQEIAAIRAATVEHPDTNAPTAQTVRWFDGRPVRPAKTLWMRVTAYSPDARSCGRWADGQTATMHSVWTNGMRLVAADTRLLPFGSIVSVPGYADGQIVPVLDRGGAIKGMRLDLLMPTHEIARRWGVRHLPVTVWQYAD